jgi:predicted DNA-binding ribbon-helix-helix protein
VALEAVFWDALRGAARTRGLSLGGLVARVDAGRDGTTPLASSLRVLALLDAQERAGDLGNGQIASAGKTSGNLTER